MKRLLSLVALAVIVARSLAQSNIQLRYDLGNAIYGMSWTIDFR